MFTLSQQCTSFCFAQRLLTKRFHENKYIKAKISVSKKITIDQNFAGYSKNLELFAKKEVIFGFTFRTTMKQPFWVPSMTKSKCTSLFWRAINRKRFFKQNG